MPAYSIGKAHRQSKAQYQRGTPGVGAYNTQKWYQVSRMSLSPNRSIPKSKKFFDPLQKNEDPVGPGSYNPQKPYKAPEVTMKGKSVVVYDYNNNPGPANYQSQVSYPTKQYSFGRSTRKFKTEIGPSPLDYEISKDSKIQGGLFNKDSREKIKSDIIPGPGDYRLNFAEVLKKSDQPVFSKTRKFLETSQTKLKNIIPGPGAYNLDSSKFRKSGIKFGDSEKNLNIKTEGPGPAAYHSQSFVEKRSPRAIIGSSKRLNSKYETLPGPATYNMPKSENFKKKNATVIFGQQERIKNSTSIIPGPGSYKLISNSQANKGYSMTARNFPTQNDKFPSPQDYNPEYNSIKTKSTDPIFGSENRLNKIHPHTNVPGPADYSTDIKKFSKTFHFGKAKRNYTEQSGSKVGPGQYKLKPYIGMYDGKTSSTKQILYV